MKYILLLSIVLAVAAVNSQLLSFTPFYSNTNCDNNVNGVGFGSLQFQCSLNFTDSVSFMVYNFYETNQYNLTYHAGPYCDNYVHYDIFTMDECTYSEYSGSSYFLTQSTTWEDVKVPSNSVTFQTFSDSACQNVQSYWYATNGTVIFDKKSPWGSTVYYCNNNKPYSTYCSPQGPCITDQIAIDDCSGSNPFKVICT